MIQIHVPIEKAITAGQVGKTQELLGASLRGADNLESRIVQRMLENDGNSLAKGMLVVVQDHYKQALLQQQLVDWVTIIDEYNIIARVPCFSKVPHHDRGVVEIHFFKINSGLSGLIHKVSHKGLEKEYVNRDLSPAREDDLQYLDRTNRLFACKYPNITHAVRTSGDLGSACFGPNGYGYNAPLEDFDTRKWWFAGVRK
jgi:hypothetical protein